MTLGVLLGSVSAAFFGAGAVCIRVGMRDRTDDGLYTTVLVNAVVLGLGVLVVSLVTSHPAWNWAGVSAFALSGVLGTWVGRGFSFRAVRRMGPSRANAFFITAPVFSAIGGWIVLGERLRLIQAFGGAVALTGLAILVRFSGQAASLAPRGGSADQLALDVPGEGETPIPRRQVLVRRLDGGRGAYVYAALAAMFLGLAFVARKYGTERYESAVVGGFVGTSTALVLLTASAAARGRLDVVRDGLRRTSPWFVLGGIAMSVGLILQFSAYVYLDAWLVSLLIGTQGLWTLMWSSVFIRQEERIRRELVLSILLVVAGVAIITIPGG